MDIDLSKRINALRFPLIIGVVFIHNYASVVNLTDTTIGLHTTGLHAILIRDYISDVLARISVPLFFLISGLLFYFDFELSVASYWGKLKTRFKTLFLPLLFWNFLVLIMIALAQSFPQTDVFFSGKFGTISSFSVFDLINAVLGITRHPIAYQFWFIRDLIVIVFMSPIILLLIKKIPQVSIITLFVLWFFNYWPLTCPYIDSLLFFSLGGYLGINKVNITEIDRIGMPLILIYFIFSICDVVTKGLNYNYCIHKSGILIGVGCAFYLAKYLITHENKKWFLTIAPASFFVFATHEPLLMVFRKIFYKTFQPNNDFMVISLYFLIPIIVMSLCLVAYHSLNNLTPRFLKTITGGR